MNDRYCCENRISYPTNCKNCGAPLHGSKCEFCGTEYPVNVSYDNKVTINMQGLAFSTVGELCKAISEQQAMRQRLNNYMW